MLAFLKCKNLTSINIPASTTLIEDWFVKSCGRLESINVDSQNPVYSSLDGILYNKKKTKMIRCPEGKKSIDTMPAAITYISGIDHCDSLTSVVIPNSVQQIGKSAFEKCGNLVSIIIPNSVKSIPSYAFSKCIKLEDVTLPDSLESIGLGAYEGCLSLKSIRIPTSVKLIKEDAFKGCGKIKTVVITNPNIMIEEGAFDSNVEIVTH